MTTTIIQFSRADWAPHIGTTARQIAQACVVVYCAGWALGAWVHRLNATLTALVVPAVPTIIQRQAAAAPPPANIAPPRVGIIHVFDPMDRAVRMVRADGRSQRLAASVCGVSRSSLQRALKA